MSLNPFHFTTPVKGEMFVGRQHLAKLIADDLPRLSGDSYVIVGGRRSGKSSLLKAIEHSLLLDLKAISDQSNEGGLDDRGLELFVVPVFVSLQGFDPSAVKVVLGHIVHRLCIAVAGKKAKIPFLPGRVIDLDLPPYNDVDPSEASLQSLQSVIEKVAEAAYERYGVPVRLALLIDEVDEVLNKPWTETLFANLRSLIYDSDVKDYVRLVLASSGQFMSVGERGSPLINSIKGCFLEPLNDEAVEMLIDKAIKLSPEVKREVVRLAGGQPFILQYLLHYLFESGMESATEESARNEARRFIHDRAQDITTWWMAIGEEGRQTYLVLAAETTWQSYSHLREKLKRSDLDLDQGLKALCYHGLVRHEGTYKEYQFCGHLFRDWAQEKCAIQVKPQEGTIMGIIQLDDQDWKRITNALESGYDVQQLERLVQAGFPNVYREVNWRQGKADVTHEVVRNANQQGVLDRIIAAIVAERPFRPDLRGLGLYYSQKSGWTVQLESNGLDIGATLERLTIAGDPFIDTTLLARWLIRVERQVCQVRCGNEYGTGFLVATDLILTCYHVVKGLIIGQVPVEDVKVRFDYRRTKPGKEPPDSQTWIGLDQDWTPPNMPFSESADTPAGIKNGLLPASSELDFALLRLEREVGDEIPQGENQPRGWVDLSADPPIPSKHTPVLIVQHPGREHKPPPQMPLQIAFATPGFEELNANKTRIAYTPSTKPGSSGSPVFDGNLKAVALHHNLGQIHSELHQLVKNNRGIPLLTIRKALTDEVRAMLTKPPDEI